MRTFAILKVAKYMSQKNGSSSSIIRIERDEINIKDPENLNLEAMRLLVTRDMVMFPGLVLPIELTRESARTVAHYAEENNVAIGVVGQINPEVETPSSFDQILNYGVLAQVIKVIELPDGTQTALVKAHNTIVIEEAWKEDSYLVGRCTMEYDITPSETDREFAALVVRIKNTTKKLLESTGEAPMGMVANLEQLQDPTEVVNFIACMGPFTTTEKYDMLRITTVKERAFVLLSHLNTKGNLAHIMEDIHRKTMKQIEESQREAFLRQQMDQIRHELDGDADDDIRELEARGARAGFPAEVAKIFDRELRKLSRWNPSQPEYATQYTYLQTLLELPWSNTTTLNKDFNVAEAALNEDHYGLEKVKERVLEQIAVTMQNPDGHAPIICLVGAPGVGKTSLGRTVAKALGREYQRVSLGGLHDEAEIRGHRRTYIGSMPGRIVDAMRRAGTRNPLLLLDEVDKIGNDYKGDPSAALLEVLDPEQNCRFHDNYVDVDYDLSHVMFMVTANTLNGVPAPLIDRMEVVEMAGYLPEEKLEIAKRHLVNRALEANGVDVNSIQFDDDALRLIINRYTAESGVRQLEKQILSVVRKVLLRRMRGTEGNVTVTPELVHELLGPEKRMPERAGYDNLPGVATGLAWTAVGGEILFIETSKAKAKAEKLTLTGNLGDVMKESATIALQWVKANAENYGIDPAIFDTTALHIHVPEGAIPKDGPSAGITMATSIVSALTGRPVREDTAMTGELTLRGKVLPVGGIKEKVLAAKRAGISHIILSADNRPDIEDLQQNYLDGLTLTFTYVKNVAEALTAALTA